MPRANAKVHKRGVVGQRSSFACVALQLTAATQAVRVGSFVAAYRKI